MFELLRKAAILGLGAIDLSEKKKRFPSSQARFCTSELKSIPFMVYFAGCQFENGELVCQKKQCVLLLSVIV